MNKYFYENIKRTFFLMITFLFLVSCQNTSDILEACNGNTLEDLKQQNFISKDCKAFIQDILPSPENNLSNSLISLGHGTNDQTTMLFFTGQNNTAAFLTDSSELTVISIKDGVETILDESQYSLKTISQITGNNISFSSIIDYSGNMSDEDISDASDMFTNLFDAMDLTTEYESNIILFSAELNEVQDFTSDTTTLKESIKPNDSIPRDSTALYDAIGTGLTSLSTRTSPVRLLIVATDGLENASTSFKTREELYQLAKSHKIPVIFLGTLLSDVDFLGDMARETGGFSIYNKDLVGLKKDFTKVIDLIKNTVVIEFLDSTIDWDSVKVKHNSKTITFDSKSENDKQNSLWKDIDLDSFQVLPMLKNLNWQNITPANNITYWEIRNGYTDDVIGAVGNKCDSAEDQEKCIADFDALRSFGGFGSNCHPPQCPKYYIVSQDSENISMVWETADDLKIFLGDISSSEEAILLTYGIGFYWGEDYKESGAIQKVDGGYQLIVLKEISGCTPAQINRYLININFSGESQLLREQILVRYMDACF